MNGNVQDSCLVYIFLKEKRWKLLLPKNIADDPRICNDFEARSFGQVQGQWKKRFIIIVCS